MLIRKDGYSGSAVRPTPVLAMASASVGVEAIRGLIAGRLASERDRRLRFLVGRLPTREDAEDVLQDFAMKAMQGAYRLSDSGKVDAWLNVSLRNTLFDRYRRAAARRRMQEGVTNEPLAADDGSDDIEGPMNCMSREVGRLKPSYAELIRRADLQQASLKLVAEELGLTANNVGVRLHRAREALRQAMRERCAACPARCFAAERFLARQVA